MLDVDGDSLQFCSAFPLRISKHERNLEVLWFLKKVNIMFVLQEKTKGYKRRDWGFRSLVFSCPFLGVLAH